jgi:uncharacterized Tic20 family protein
MTEGNVPPPPPPPSDPTPATSLPYQPVGGSGYPGPYVGPEPDKDSKMMGMLAHLLSIFLGFLGPLIIWLIKKDTSPFVDDQGKEALNFQLVMLIAWLVGGATACFGIGLIVIFGAWLCTIIFGILGALEANKGNAYRYPFNIRFVK